jgi:hypothetical protein
MKTERTIKCKRLGILFTSLSWVLCFGLAVAFVIAFLAMNGSGNGEQSATMKEKFGTIVYGFGLSLIPMLVLAIIVKDKIRPTVWMIDVILANYLFGSWLMYVVFAIWLIDQYVIGPLGKHYRQLYTINKEIDRR